MLSNVKLLRSILCLIILYEFFESKFKNFLRHYFKFLNCCQHYGASVYCRFKTALINSGCYLPAEDDQRKFVKHHGILTSVAAFFRIYFVPMNFTDATISIVFSRIMANNSRERLFFLSHLKGAIIRGRRFKYCSLEVVFVLFYYPVISKNNHIK